jgi:hypothetical protein
MDLHARVRGMPLSLHHLSNVAIVVMVAVTMASAAAYPLLGNNCPKNDHKAAMRAVLSLVLQVVDLQQRQ